MREEGRKESNGRVKRRKACKERKRKKVVLGKGETENKGEEMESKMKEWEIKSTYG